MGKCTLSTKPCRATLIAACSVPQRDGTPQRNAKRYIIIFTKGGLMRCAVKGHMV